MGPVYPSYRAHGSIAMSATEINKIKSDIEDIQRHIAHIISNQDKMMDWLKMELKSQID